MAAGPAAADTDIPATDAYAGPSKPQPVKASNTNLKIGNEYKLTVNPASRGGRRLGSAFQIEVPAQDTWQTIDAKTAQAGFE